MPDLGRLTTGELSTTMTALSWLSVNMKERGILEPAVTSKLKVLLVACHEEKASRERAERKERDKAVAERIARSSRST